MKTQNWQIKILTLCMAAFALCLTVACGDFYPDEEPVAKRIMPLGPCPNDINEVPEDPILSSSQRLNLKADHAHEIFDKHHFLLFNGQQTSISYDAVTYVGIDSDSKGSFFRYHESYPQRYLVVIEIGFVSDDVDQSKLPPEKRIPHCLEGVPVHFLTNQPEARIDG